MNRLKNYIFMADGDGSKVDFSALIGEITKWTNAVLGTLVLLLVLFAVLKAVWIWFSVVRTSDNPDTRAIFLNALKWPFVAIVGVLVLIGIANVGIRIVKSFDPKLSGAD